MPSKILRGEDLRTDIILQNIPNRMTQRQLEATLERDISLMPTDKNGKNLGYAFCEAEDAEDVLLIWKKFHGRSWQAECPGSSKRCVVRMSAYRVQKKG